MEIKRVTKKLRLSRADSIKYQLLTEICLVRKENLIPSDLEILTLLVLVGTPTDLSTFCATAASTIYNCKPGELAVRSQNIRNRVVKLEKRNIISKTDSGRKMIALNDSIEIHDDNKILLSYNYLVLETTKA